MKYDKAELVKVEDVVQKLTRNGVEKAQEDVQGADESAGDRGRPPNPPQGHGPPKYVHTEAWGRGWPNERRGGVPVARSSVLMSKNSFPHILKS